MGERDGDERLLKFSLHHKQMQGKSEAAVHSTHVTFPHTARFYLVRQVTIVFSREGSRIWAKGSTPMAMMAVPNFALRPGSQGKITKRTLVLVGFADPSVSWISLKKKQTERNGQPCTTHKSN